jgi:hypothetical protein
MKLVRARYNPADMPTGRTPINWLARLVMLGMAATGTLPAGPDGVRTFENEPAGRPPAGFVLHVVRYSAPPRWLVQREATNGFLSSVGDAAGHAGFALAILEGEPRRDLSLSARVRLAAGVRSGGIVWRVQDAENYYLARLDLDRQDIGLYRVVNGNRTRIEGEDDLELDPNAWHTLKVVQADENIRVYLGGIRVLRARDRAFAKPGGAGLWCTGDAVAHFDDLRLTTPERGDHGDNDAGSRRGR